MASAFKFFVPNVVQVFVEHDPQMPVEQVADMALSRVQQFFKEATFVDNSKPLLFTRRPDDQNRGSSLVTIRVGFIVSAEKELLQTIFDTNRSLGQLSRDDFSRDGQDGVESMTVLPNLLTGGQPDARPIGTGGPGAHHELFDGAEVPTKVPSFAFNFPPDVKLDGPFEKDVDIYILDSLGTLQSNEFVFDLQNDRAIQMTVVNNAEFVKAINAEFSTIESTTHLPNYGENETLPNHGVFVGSLIAAIIDSMANKIAGKFKLHLIPILNEKCIGTLGSFLAGLNEFATLRKNASNDAPTSFVVNMSISFAEPVYAALELGFDLTNEAVQNDLITLSAALVQIIRFATAFASSQDTFVAAAGNTNAVGVIKVGSLAETIKIIIDLLARNVPRKVLDRFVLPLYPASADEVTGVGALDRNLSPAPYSLLADIGHPIEPLPGIWTFGGDAIAPIVGQVDHNMFVKWQGTSFAAAIVTGVKALLLSQSNAAPTLSQLCTQLPYADDPTIILGHALDVKQV